MQTEWTTVIQIPVTVVFRWRHSQPLWIQLYKIPKRNGHVHAEEAVDYVRTKKVH